MLDKRFTILFVVVTAILAVAVYLADQAVVHGGAFLTVLAATSAVVGSLGFVVLARIIVLVERQRGQR
jgi:hypothetical protein